MGTFYFSLRFPGFSFLQVSSYDSVYPINQLNQITCRWSFLHLDSKQVHFFKSSRKVMKCFISQKFHFQSTLLVHNNVHKENITASHCKSTSQKANRPINMNLNLCRFDNKNRPGSIDRLLLRQEKYDISSYDQWRLTRSGITESTNTGRDCRNNCYQVNEVGGFQSKMKLREKANSFGQPYTFILEGNISALCEGSTEPKKILYSQWRMIWRPT